MNGNSNFGSVVHDSRIMTLQISFYITADLDHFDA